MGFIERLGRRIGIHASKTAKSRIQLSSKLTNLLKRVKFLKLCRKLKVFPKHLNLNIDKNNKLQIDRYFNKFNRLIYSLNVKS